MPECRNAGTLEHRNAGMPKRRNSKTRNTTLIKPGNSWRSVRRAEKYSFIQHTKIGKPEFFGQMEPTYYLLVLLANVLFFYHKLTPVTRARKIIEFHLARWASSP